MSWRFNGGRGAITCDLCNVIIKEPAVREDSKNPDGDDVAAEFDLCVDIAACNLRQIRRAAKVPRFFPENFGWYGQGVRVLKEREPKENIFIGVDFARLEDQIHFIVCKLDETRCIICEMLYSTSIGGLAALVQLGEFGEPV